MTTRRHEDHTLVGHPEGRRRRRRSSRRRQLARRSALVAVVLVSAFVAVYVLTVPKLGPPSAVGTLQDIVLASLPESANPSRVSRPVYRHSVIPGGAYDRRELAAAFATDPVVAAHYRDFDLANTRVVRVDQPRAVHVSYRVGGHVYWTKGKVWLQPGEALLTDGVQEARSRCGNRVAEVVPGPVAPEDPPLAELDQPVAVEPPGISPLRAFDLMFPEAPPSLPTLPATFSVEPLLSLPISIMPTPPVLLVERLSPPPSGEVPEPGTLVLLCSGAFAAARLARRRPPKPRTRG